MRKTKREAFEVMSGDVRVKVYPIRYQKNGTTYETWVVKYTEGGQRKLVKRASREEAEALAEQIAANKEAQRGTLTSDGFRSEIRHALEAVYPTKISILPACQLFAQAVKILGSADDLLSACQYWATNKPSKPFTPRTADEFMAEFVGKPSKRCARRQRTLKSSLRTFCRKFGTTLLHEVQVADLTEFVDAQSWAPKTRNCFLADVSLFYSKASLCGHVTEGCNPTKTVERLDVPRNACGIFTPTEMKAMMYRLAEKAPELVPFMALWSFAGIRKEEVARMTWPQVTRGLHTGFIELHGDKVKANGTRNVPVLDNLRAWLTAFRQDTGYVLPAQWREGFKLDEISRCIARRTRLLWVDNGPRHSFATYRFKLLKDPGQVTLEMGTSLAKFQRHYWSKSQVVTDDEARAWFAVMPPTSANVVPMPKTDIAQGAPPASANRLTGGGAG